MSDQGKSTPENNPYASPASVSSQEASGVPIAGQMQPGFRAAQWRMLLVTMFCYLFYYTGRQTFGFAIPGIQDDLGISKATLGWASTCLLWSYAVGQTINGNMADKFGGRRIMSAGAVLSCGLNWVTSFGTSVATLIVPWGMNGFVQSMGWAPGGAVIGNWWGKHRRGEVFGLYVFAAGLSSILSFATSLIILDVLGLSWRWIFRLPVCLLLIGGVVYYLVARDRPQDLGFDPAAEDEDSPDESTDDAGAGNEKSAADTSAAETSLSRYGAVLTNYRFMIASIAIGFESIARYGLVIWVPVHFLGEDWKHSEYKWVSIALPIGMALGALTSGWVSDRVFKSRRWPLISLFSLAAAISSLGMFFVDRSSIMLGVIGLFFCGFFVYGPQSAFWALCPDLLGRKRAGTGTGIMNAHAYIFAGLAEPAIGWSIETFQIVGGSGKLVDNTGLVFLAVAGASLICALIAPLIRR